jgi:hypothetical protein
MSEDKVFVEATVREIRRRTRKKYSAEEKMRIGFCGCTIFFQTHYILGRMTQFVSTHCARYPVPVASISLRKPFIFYVASMI